MQTKTILIVLALMVGAIAIMGFKLMSARSTPTAAGNTNSALSLSTNPNPPAPGQVTFMIDVKDKSGKAVETAKVSFDLNMTTMNMGTQQGEATSMGNGRYSAVGTVSMRGPWRARVKAAMPDGSVQNQDFVLNVQ